MMIQKDTNLTIACDATGRDPSYKVIYLTASGCEHNDFPLAVNASWTTYSSVKLCVVHAWNPEGAGLPWRPDWCSPSHDQGSTGINLTSWFNDGYSPLNRGMLPWLSWLERKSHTLGDLEVASSSLAGSIVIDLFLDLICLYIVLNFFFFDNFPLSQFFRYLLGSHYMCFWNLRLNYGRINWWRVVNK